MVNVTQAALATGEPARRWGSAHAQIVPYQTFEASDGALVLAVGNDEQWRRLCAALALPDLAAERFATNPDRVLHRAEVVETLAVHFRGGARDEWLARLGAARVPAGPVRDVTEVMRDPALASRDMVRETVLPGSGARVPLLGPPWRADGVRPALELPPPALGGNTAEFLAAFAK
jgi:crotonobetainyl-CoA:carnitine CoA-transferase CaiB-like acyl-CoA transferase